MKMVIQRVNHASVTIDGEVHGAIEKGFLVLLGVGQDDTEEIADKYVKKMVGLRIFDDEEGKTNLSLDQVGGSVLLIGNEGRGLTDELAGMADRKIRIPMRGRVESLNAAIAATVLVYEAQRQRGWK